MLRSLLLLSCIGLCLAGCGREQGEDPKPPESRKVPARRSFTVPQSELRRLREALPHGWSVRSFGNVVEVRRGITITQQIMSLPSNAKQTSVTFPDGYEIWLAFSEELSAAGYRRLMSRWAEERRQLAELAEKLRPITKQGKLQLSFDPRTDRERALVDRFWKLKQTVAHHRVTDVRRGEHCTVSITPPRIAGQLAAADRYECAKGLEQIRRLYRKYEQAGQQ